jgi:Zn-dependent peptidase ImmA (M78 family)
METIARNKSTAVKNAERLINEYRISGPVELDLELAANAEGIVVEESDLGNLLGKITYDTECGIIKINCRIKEEGQKRFTLAHELGHYFNEYDLKTNPFYQHIDHFFSFNTGKKFEDEANEFAAELLMHKPWFGKYIKDRKINIELLKDISKYFRVSLSAAGYRYANIGRYPCAIIFSTGGAVRWKAINEYFPFQFLRYNSSVPKESAAADFFEGKEMQSCEDLIEAKHWFPEDRKITTGVYLYEQSAAMPSYNSVLTLLWESEFK